MLTQIFNIYNIPLTIQNFKFLLHFYNQQSFRISIYDLFYCLRLKIFLLPFIKSNINKLLKINRNNCMNECIVHTSSYLHSSLYALCYSNTCLYSCIIKKINNFIAAYNHILSAFRFHLSAHIKLLFLTQRNKLDKLLHFNI